MATLATESETRPLVPENVLHNARQVAYVRNMTSPVFGLVAGTLGMTSYVGFLFYLVTFTFISLLIVTFMMKGHPERYCVPSYTAWTSQLGTGIASYILTWTLFYGLVHVYD